MTNDPDKSKIKAEGNKIAAYNLFKAFLFLGLSIGALYYWGYHFNKGLDPISKFWIILPLTTIGFAIYLLVISIILLFSTIRAFFLEPHFAGETIEDTIRNFYEGVLPDSVLDPPFHNAWACLVDSAKKEFYSIKEFKKYWRNLRDPYFPAAPWKAQISKIEQTNDNAEVYISLIPDKLKKGIEIGPRSEIVRLTKIGQYWFMQSGKFSELEDLRIKIENAKKEIDKEYIFCKKCGHPIPFSGKINQDEFCIRCLSNKKNK
jgi:hypothetical protein